MIENTDVDRMNWIENDGFIYQTRYRKAWGAYGPLTPKDHKGSAIPSFGPTARAAIDAAMALERPEPIQMVHCCGCKCADEAAKSQEQK